MKSLKCKIRRMRTVLKNDKVVLLTVEDDRGLVVDAENNSRRELQTMAARLFRTVYKLKS